MSILFLDNILQYSYALWVSKYLFQLSAIVAILFAGISILLYFFSMKNKKAKFVLVFVTILMVFVAICSIILGADERYKKQDISSEYPGPYLGQITNGQPDGWGKLYDEEYRILYVGGFKNGEYSGNGKAYSYDGDSVTILEGTYLSGKLNGKGTETLEIETISQLIYEGDYVDGKRCGHGTYYGYDDDGLVSLQYSGGWYNSLCWGYGTKICKNGDKITKRSRGLYENNKLNGILKFEFIANENEKYVYVGNTSEGQYAGEGVLYYKHENENEFSYCQGIDLYYEEDENGYRTYYFETSVEEDLREEYPFPSDCIFN